MLRLLGLTGGIAAGKSTVALLLRERNVPVLDADAINRDILRPGGAAFVDVATRWPGVLGSDGAIDRKALASIVFADPAERAVLEAFTHPRIRAVVAAESRRLEAEGHRLAFLEAALLVETGFYKHLQGLVVVTAPEDVQRRRLLERDACSPADADARLRAQLSMAEKIRVADYVIDNGGAVSSTAAQVEELLRRLA